MRRLKTTRALALLASVLLLPCSGAGSRGDDPPPPPIKEVMGTLNKGPEALTSSIGRNLDKAMPDWRTLAKQCSEYIVNVKHLGKSVPPRGEPASWERLTRSYLDDAKAMDSAVKARDRKAALAAHQKIERDCARCHVAHKP
jgi:hypothetical protein